MRSDLSVTLLTLAILTVTGIAAADYGVEGEDYEEKTVIIKFVDDITVNTVLTERVEEYVTGNGVIDSISDTLDVCQFEKVTPLPGEPVNHRNGYWTWNDLLSVYEEYGLGRIYIIRYNSDTTVSDALNMYITADDIAESGEPNCFWEPCVTTPNDEKYDFEWYLNDALPGALSVNHAWDYTHGSGDTVIAILDSGINMVHPDLNDKIYSPWDCFEQNDRPLDYYRHGTFCAGIAAAETNMPIVAPIGSGLGIAGADWNALIMPVKVARVKWVGMGPVPGWDLWDQTTESTERGLWHAMYCGADIISMSFKGNFSSFSSVEDYCDAAYNLGSRGILLFAGAGNDNDNKIPKPARYGTVICVGAIDYNAYRVTPGGGWSWGSNYGPEMELCAPGVSMYSTGPPIPDPNAPFPLDLLPSYNWPVGSTNYDKYYAGFQGTSGATP